MAATFGHVASHSRRPRSGSRARGASAGATVARSSSTAARRRVGLRWSDQPRAWASTSSRSWSVTVAASVATSGESIRRGRSIGTSKLAVTRPGPRRHDDDAIAEPGRLADVVGHEQHGQPPVADVGVELVVERVAGHRVEGAERLVHQQHVGLLGQRPGQRAALAHAARQLVRSLLGEGTEVHRLDAAASPARRRSALGTPASFIGSSTLACTVSHGNSADSWNISAVAPSTSTVPDVGASRPATRLRIVDLPHPDAPMRHTNSPRGDLEVDVGERGDGAARRCRTSWRRRAARPRSQPARLRVALRLRAPR